MTKQIFFLFLLVFSTVLTAQNSIEEELELLQTPKEIETFLKSTKSKKSMLVTFNEEKHKTTLAKQLFELSIGGVKTIKTDYDKTIYKVIEKTEALNYRVRYIALDGNILNKNDISNTRASILKKYNNGASFDFLAQRYSMDKNATRGGDTGWFSEVENMHEFEDIIIANTHAVDDIFTIDMPSTNKYYVILKTHEPKNIAEINVLKIVEPIE